MIDDDIPLDGVIGLPIPHTRGFVKIEVIAERKFFQTCVLHGVRVMDHDVCDNVVSAPITFRQNRADAVFVDVILRDEAGVVRYDNGFAPIGFEAFGLENLFREPQFPANGAIRVGVLEDTCAGEDGSVRKVAFVRVVRLIERNTVKPYYAGQFWGHKSSPPSRSLGAYSRAITSLPSHFRLTKATKKEHPFECP